MGPSNAPLSTTAQHQTPSTFYFLVFTYDIDKDAIAHFTMATPQSPSSDAGGKKPEHEQVTFRFCSECSNMLYPKEDVDSHKLQFTCRTCQYTEDAQSTCVFRNVLNTSAGETAGVTQDVGSDPTLPRSNKTCPSCKHEEAVFFQSQQRSAETEMKLFYVCCNSECGHIFQ